MTTYGLNHDDIFYLSGPMTGLPDFNYPYFTKVAKRLRGFGLNVRSPHEVKPPPDSVAAADHWKWYMDRCMESMTGCNAIILLRGWPSSAGAKIELDRALQEKWTVYYYLDGPGMDGRPVRMSGW